MEEIVGTSETSIEVQRDVIALYSKAELLTSGAYGDVIKYIISQPEGVAKVFNREMNLSYDESHQLFTLIDKGNTFYLSADNKSVYFRYNNLEKKTKIRLSIGDIADIKNPVEMSSTIDGKKVKYTTFESQKKFLSDQSNITDSKTVLREINLYIDIIIDEMGKLRKEILSTKNKELQNILKDSAIYSVLQEFFAEQKVPEQDWDIITETIKKYGHDIFIQGNEVSYHDHNEDVHVYLRRLLKYDPESENKIVSLATQAKTRRSSQ